MVPRYKRVVEYVQRRGDTLVPLWLDAGITILYPFEIAAGMDVTALRKEFGPDLLMYMGLDKRALVRTFRSSE